MSNVRAHISTSLALRTVEAPGVAHLTLRNDGVVA